MHTVIVGILTTLAMPVLAAQTPAAAQTQPRYAALSAAVASGKAADVTAFYADEASFELRTPGGYDRVRGADSIGGLWQKAMSDGAVGFDVTIAEATTEAGAIVDKGTFVMRRKDGTVFVKGTCTAEWRKVGADWKLVRHIVVVSGQ
jgi:ketosteroid isomerase-like protein